MTMGSSWIKLHRKLLKHPRAKDPHWLAVWVYLLLSATHNAVPNLFRGKAITLYPGQLITGVLVISERTGVDRSKVWRILKTLKSEKQIEILASNRSSLISIVNWGEHQNVEYLDGKQVSTKRVPGEYLVSTSQEGEEDKKVEEEPPIVPPAPALPPKKPAARKLAVSISDEKATEIYRAHPIKKEPRSAKRAILKAVQRGHSPEFLLDRTRRYAEIRNGDLGYQKHPTSWFNADCFLEDEAEWSPDRNEGASAGAGRPTTLGARLMALKTKLDALKDQERELKSYGSEVATGLQFNDPEDNKAWLAKVREVRAVRDEMARIELPK